MNANTFSIIFQKLRTESSLTQDELAKKLGISKSTIGMWETGKRLPSPELYEQIADFFNVDIDYLYGRTTIRQRVHYDNDGTEYVPILHKDLLPIGKKRLPLFDGIACGEPRLIPDGIEVYIDITTDIQADYVLKAHGNSMTGARINDGDLVFIRQQPTVENGEIAAVLIEDAATLKRVYWYSQKTLLVLRAENPDVKDLEFSGDKLENVKILGKAVAFQSDVK